MNATTTEAFGAVSSFLSTQWGQTIGFVVALLAVAFGFILAIAGIRWAWRRVTRIGR